MYTLKELSDLGPTMLICMGCAAILGLIAIAGAFQMLSMMDWPGRIVMGLLVIMAVSGIFALPMHP